MSNYISYIGLQENPFERLSVVYRGYANALRKQDKPDAENRPRNRQIIIANCYMVAAIYTSIYNQPAALPIFSEAARAYLLAGDSRWKIMVVCSQNLGLIPDEREAFMITGNALELYRELLLQYYLNARGEKVNLSFLLDYIYDSPILMTTTIGHAAVPLRIYESIIANTYSPRPYSRSVDPFSLLDELFRRNTDLIDALKSYRFHWQTQVSMLPFEPEFLGFLLGMQTQSRGASLLADFRRRRGNEQLIWLIDLAADMLI